MVKMTILFKNCDNENCDIFLSLALKHRLCVGTRQHSNSLYVLKKNNVYHCESQGV